MCSVVLTLMTIHKFKNLTIHSFNKNRLTRVTICQSCARIDNTLVPAYSSFLALGGNEQISYMW